MKKITLLGATGSVGESVISVIREFAENFQLIGFSAWTNVGQTLALIKEFSPKYVVLKSPHPDLPLLFPDVTFFYGEEGLLQLIQEESDTVVSAILGFAGLIPALETLKNGKILITANKESIVAGGNFLKKAAKKSGAKIIPLDSEHLALFELLRSHDLNKIDELVITGSGGPFLDEFIDASIDKKAVLQHPTWKNMGQHITVASALMINKGFEIIEAMHLFDVPESKIRVLIHPQSLVHAAINTKGGSWHLLAGPTDMRYSSQYALFLPEIPLSKPFSHFDLANQSLEFLEPDYDKFRLLALARVVARAEGILPTILCASVEVAIDQFLEGNIKFYKIPDLIQEMIDKYPNKQKPSLEEILDIYKKSKIATLERITFNGDDLR